MIIPLFSLSFKPEKIPENANKKKQIEVCARNNARWYGMSKKMSYDLAVAQIEGKTNNPWK